MVFSLPSLPSFQSVRSLLDTEPQVLYPSSATNHTRPPPSPVRAPTNAAGRVLPPVPDWDRGRPTQAQGHRRGRRQSQSQSRSVAAGPSSSNGLGLNFNPSSHGNGNGLAPGCGKTGQGQGQTRPTHRRSQSAVPAITATSLPLGRLTEYSRNSLASTSATSLPTLVEHEIDNPGAGTGAGTAAGIGGEGQTRTRRSSRASIYSQHSQHSQHSNYSPYSQGVSLPSSPLRPAATISQSVPLPLDLSVPPPPRARNQLLTRPPPTPRAWSSADVRLRVSPPNSAQDCIPGLQPGDTNLNGRMNMTRHASYIQGHGKGKGSISQVSDVAVLATWSFPDTHTDSSSSSSSSRGRRTSDQGVSNLADRLKSLSTLQTDLGPLALPHHSSANTPTDTNPNAQALRRPSNASLAPHPSPGFGPTILSSTPRNAGHPRIVHRSSHSSPNILNAARKGLRQPVPLGSGSGSAHGHGHAPSYLNRSNSNAHLGSSPGSLLSSSDTTDTSSPTSSLHSLPGQPPQAGGGGMKGWRMPWSRRNSIANANADASGKRDEDDMRERSFEDEDDREVISCGSDGSDDEEEHYIDYAQIALI